MVFSQRDVHYTLSITLPVVLHIYIYIYTTLPGAERVAERGAARGGQSVAHIFLFQLFVHYLYNITFAPQTWRKN